MRYACLLAAVLVAIGGCCTDGGRVEHPVAEEGPKNWRGVDSVKFASKTGGSEVFHVAAASAAATAADEYWRGNAGSLMMSARRILQDGVALGQALGRAGEFESELQQQLTESSTGGRGGGGSEVSGDGGGGERDRVVQVEGSREQQEQQQEQQKGQKEGQQEQQQEQLQGLKEGQKEQKGQQEQQKKQQKGQQEGQKEGQKEGQQESAPKIFLYTAAAAKSDPDSALPQEKATSLSHSTSNIQPIPYRTSPLLSHIRSSDLKVFHLGLFPHANSQWLQCRGCQCPKFCPCTEPEGIDLGEEGNKIFAANGRGNEAAESIEACFAEDFLNSEVHFLAAPRNCPLLHDERSRVDKVFNSSCMHRSDATGTDPTALQIVKLPNAFVDKNGLSFTRQLLFDRNGCKKRAEFSYAPHSTFVTELHEAINLAYPAASNFFHFFIESLPSLLLAARLLRERPAMPLILARNQLRYFRRIAEPLLGIPLSFINYFHVSDNELILARTLYQPTFPPCGRPHHAAWRFIRQRYLLRATPASPAIPFLNDDWTERRQPDTAEEAADDVAGALRDDWTVVVSTRKDTARSLKQADDLERVAAELFPSRLHLFNGSSSILQAKALFARSRLFVAMHGAAMSNMVFMPRNATVVELRPSGHPVACYHQLAEACDLNYFLFLGNGTFSSDLDVDLGPVEELLRQLKSEIK